MQKNILHIIWVMLLLGFAGMVYFLALVVGLPFIITVVLVILSGYFGLRWLRKNIETDEITITKPYIIILSYCILLTGIIILTSKGYYIEKEYGDWDAWWIWNYHALFLQHPAYWWSLFSVNPEFHPDYPLYVPSVIAFFRRLTGSGDAVIPFVFSYFITLAVPVSIYLALYRKNLLIAALVLLLVATNEFYLVHGLAQYADLPLGFLFLCAFICLGISQKQPAVVAVIAGLLGCCIWMKNEGIMLSLIFMFFNIRTLFAHGRWKYFLPVIALPVLTLVIFKNMAPATDIIEGQRTKTSGFLFDASRYKLVWQYIANNFNDNFKPVEIGLVIYAAVCIIQRRLPGKDMLILLSCLAGYCFVYIMTPKSLEWHLQTSMDRVLFQLMPSFIYVLGLRFSGLKLSLSNKQLQ